MTEIYAQHTWDRYQNDLCLICVCSVCIYNVAYREENVGVLASCFERRLMLQNKKSMGVATKTGEVNLFSVGVEWIEWMNYLLFQATIVRKHKKNGLNFFNLFWKKFGVGVLHHGAFK